MSGYFGTEAQQRLQAQAEASADFIAATPGAYQAGRSMGCDDPDRLGWDRIHTYLERDGVCGFRLIAADREEELRSRLAARAYRLDTWDVFLADRATALAAAGEALSRPLPDGLRELKRPTDPDGEYTARIQALMGSAGVVPFSGSFLVGAMGSATTVVIGDEDGNIVAAAHGYLPHNAHSPYHRHAWGGLVAVADAQRGRGLGNHVNARMVARVFEDLGATHIYELVSVTNLASRRMVTSSGLCPEPNLVCGMATANDSARFTR
ncbi:GNAT family N-acetyltransferase [Mycoplana sp. MJR14]|uniref:GNAT family N-acetyltransferase n=1 Tax=Mycoplana sp. MJR14 TaxID=3032583 RepID=UPI0023DA98B7|nr:GNAT family N-acetyltransferase [Mycoplana sp. MJR14]MDF1632081.1 GNAT family N-acetyltransferase [Mycoplana sp. MJR14]